MSLPTTVSARETAMRRVAPTPSVAVQSFSELVVLGDSLSDCGNAGRFCDGPVWVELLAADLELEARPARRGGTNFAVGGAHIAGGENDLSHQLDALLERCHGRLDPDALYVVYAGGNDLLAGMASVHLFHAAERAAVALDGILGRMVEAGARRFLLANLPDLGLTPAVVSFAIPLSKLARRLTRTFNARLADMVAARNATGEARMVLVDVFGKVQRMTSGEPAATRLLFCDRMHPAASVHRHIAAVAAEAVAIRSHKVSINS